MQSLLPNNIDPHFMPGIKSQLDGHVEYEETRDIRDEDRGGNTTLYELEIGPNKTARIAIGKMMEKGKIVFFPIYHVPSKSADVVQIGVFEFLKDDLPALMDDEGEVVLDGQEPLLYSFGLEELSAAPVPVSAPVQHIGGGESDSESDTEPTPPTPPTRPKKHPPFTIFPKEHTPLPKEDATQAEELRKEFRSTNAKSVNPVAKLMKNLHYTVVPTAGGILAVIIKAFDEIGWKTTPDELRRLLARETDAELFAQERDVYVSFQNTLHELTQTLETIGDRAQAIPKIMKSASITTQKTLLQELKQLSATKKNLETEITRLGDFQTKAAPCKMADLAAYRQHIMTSPDYCADVIAALPILEKFLNVKIVVFQPDAGKHLPHHRRIWTASTSHFVEPRYYILAVRRQKTAQFDLVQYKQHGILTFSELPYDLVLLAQKSAQARPPSPFQYIHDFRTTAAAVPLPPAPADRAVFRIGPAEPDTPLYEISDADGEQMPRLFLPRFAGLANIPHWRRMLSDDYPCLIVLDDHRWASVSHYVCAAAFKKGNPWFYLQLTSDMGDSAITAEMARAMTSSTGLYKKKLLRDPQKVRPDADADAQMFRRQALTAKLNGWGLGIPGSVPTADSKFAGLACFGEADVVLIDSATGEEDTLLIEILRK